TSKTAAPGGNPHIDRAPSKGLAANSPTRSGPAGGVVVTVDGGVVELAVWFVVLAEPSGGGVDPASANITAPSANTPMNAPTAIRGFRDWLPGDPAIVGSPMRASSMSTGGA